MAITVPKDAPETATYLEVCFAEMMNYWPLN